MKHIARIALLVTNILSFVMVAIFGMTGIIYDLLGPAGYEKMLVKINIPWSFERIWTFMCVCVAISIITYLLRKKFFNA